MLNMFGLDMYSSDPISGETIKKFVDKGFTPDRVNESRGYTTASQFKKDGIVVSIASLITAPGYEILVGSKDDFLQQDPIPVFHDHELADTAMEMVREYQDGERGSFDDF